MDLLFHNWLLRYVKVGASLEVLDARYADVSG